MPEGQSRLSALESLDPLIRILYISYISGAVMSSVPVYDKYPAIPSISVRNKI